MYEKSGLNDTDEFSCAMLMEPAGIETAVSAFFRLRIEWWGRLTPEFRTLLLMSDQIGLEAAIRLTFRELSELAGKIPAALWDACIPSEGVSLEEPVFAFARGRGEVVAEVARMIQC